MNSRNAPLIFSALVAILFCFSAATAFQEEDTTPNPDEAPATSPAPVRRRPPRRAEGQSRRTPLLKSPSLGPTLGSPRDAIPTAIRVAIEQPTVASPTITSEQETPAHVEPITAPAARQPAIAAESRVAAAKTTTPPKSPGPRPLWIGLFQREELGFDLRTPQRLLVGASEILADWTRSPGEHLDGLRRLPLADWLGGAAFFLLFGGTLLIERIPIKRRRRLRGRLFRGVRRHPFLRVLLWICWMTAPPVLALAIWSLAGRLLQAHTEPGFEVGRSLLCLWAGLRALRVSLHLLVRRFDLDARVGGRLERTLWFTAFWLVGWLTAAWLQAPEEAQALWAKAGHLVIVLSLFSALRRPEPLQRLLPAEGRTGKTFQAALANFYTPLVYASLVVALLWVAGFERLADVFLGRGWALVGLAVLAALAYRHSMAFYARMLGHREESALQRLALVEGARPAVAVLIAGAAVWFGVRILELQQPLGELFALVWIRVGAVSVTGDSLWGSVVFVGGTLLLSRWLQAYLAYRVYPNIGVAAGEAYAVNRLLHYALVVAGLLLALNSLGLPPSSLAIILGGFSIGIGFGLQEIANNLASGLILLTSRQVRQGDLISVGDRMGTVREVNLRSTIVTTAENVDLLIPNSKLLGDVLVNWTYSNSVGMAKVKFGVAYGSDADTVIALALRIANSHPEVLDDPCPEVWLVEFADSSLNFELLIRVDMRASVRPRVVSAIYLELLKEFATAGIEIPFPQRDVRVLSKPEAE